MKPTFVFATCSVLSFFSSASAAPVTGWTIGLDNANAVSLSNAGTSSPTLGDNTAEDADNTSIYAAFSGITLNVGEKLTLSGSMQLNTAVGAAPSSFANELRIGIFDHNGNSGINNWLGYYASAPSGTTGSGVRRRSSGAYYSQSGTTLLYTNFVSDTSHNLTDATYDFALSLERTSSGILLELALDSDAGYSLVPFSFEDTGANTFTFDRVGILVGNGLNADQVQFNNIDVSAAPVPEPSTLALLAIGTLALTQFRRASSRNA